MGPIYGSQHSPINSDHPPNFDSLSRHDQCWLHFVATCIGRKPNYVTNYLFVEMGWRKQLSFMSANGWLTATGSGLDRAYELTEIGHAALKQLDEEFGVCETAPVHEIQDDE